MRLPLLAAALAVTATAVPSDAAFYPVCGVQLVAAATGTEKSCHSGNTPTSPNVRRFTIQGVQGTVEATLTCFNYPRTNGFAATTVTGTERKQISMTEWGSCLATLTAVTDGATASGLSTFTPIWFQEP
jgi:hypothetical protein